MCHLLTRYQSTIFPNHKSCVRKKGVPAGATFKTYPAKNTYKGEYPIEGYNMLEAECGLEGGKGKVVVRMSSKRNMR